MTVMKMQHMKDWWWYYRRICTHRHGVKEDWGGRGGSGAAAKRYSPLGWNTTARILRGWLITHLRGWGLCPYGYPPFADGIPCRQSHVCSRDPLEIASRSPFGWNASEIIEFSNRIELAQAPLAMSQIRTSCPRHPLATMLAFVGWYLTVQGVRGWPLKTRKSAPESYLKILTVWSPWVVANVCPSGDIAIAIVDKTASVVSGKSFGTKFSRDQNDLSREFVISSLYFIPVSSRFDKWSRSDSFAISISTKDPTLRYSSSLRGLKFNSTLKSFHLQLSTQTVLTSLHGTWFNIPKMGSKFTNWSSMINNDQWSMIPFLQFSTGSAPTAGTKFILTNAGTLEV